MLCSSLGQVADYSYFFYFVIVSIAFDVKLFCHDFNLNIFSGLATIVFTSQS